MNIKINNCLYTNTDKWYKIITKIASISKGNLESKNPEKLIYNLANWGHLVPFEFVSFSCKLTAPKTSIIQMIRHRGFSIVERSMRYTKPLEKYKEYESLLEKTGGNYEFSRKHLPLGYLNEAYFSGNLRTWAHFIKLRRSKHAENDIRIISKLIENKFEEICPLTYTAIIENINNF